MPNTLYNQNNNTTYGWDDQGNFIGQQPGTPDKFNPATMGADTGTAKKEMLLKGFGVPSDGEGSIDWKQFSKDTAVNALSQAPLAIATDGIGPGVLKILGSLGLGVAGDQVLNPKHSLGESTGEAALNTGVGMAIPGLVENKYVKPNLDGGSTATGQLAKLLREGFSRFNPGNYTARTTTQMLQPKPGMPNVPTNVPVDLGKMIQQSLIKKTGGAVNAPPQLLRGMVPFAVNEMIDSTANSTKQE